MVFRKIFLATMKRMEPEELNQAREPSAEAGAAVPLGRESSLPETQRMEGRERGPWELLALTGTLLQGCPQSSLCGKPGGHMKGPWGHSLFSELK